MCFASRDFTLSRLTLCLHPTLSVALQLFSVTPTTTLPCFSSPSHSSLSLSLVCIPLHVRGVLCCMSLLFSIRIILSTIAYNHFYPLLSALLPTSLAGDLIAPHCLHILYLYLHLHQHLFTCCITFLLALSVPDQ
ncbi:hypothetical protein BDV40DRAFT_277281 [Aspergillus tamarii]|uniref:Uncharacterized protein n=1 Tax=Aspergillus tamarii TaxID=41984 RepID=A0A5N6UGQ5_ASPTM|nr:hypothetical protein BDV40DRAFT_277281 [Aspergillus tamarii]